MVTKSRRGLAKHSARMRETRCTKHFFTKIWTEETTWEKQA